jgi:hypothetical protein
MRALVAVIALGLAGAALLPSSQAKAWWDGYGRWHPDHYRPRVVVVPRPYYARPYARWIPPHYTRWGQFIPGHWA